MTGFCVREMRKEYRGVSRLYAGTAMLFLLAFACIGVIMRVREADIRFRGLLLGLDIVAVLGLLGIHLILTDEKRLIQNTPFGAFLRDLGDPNTIMREIDQSASKQLDCFPSFALTDGWLILFYPSGWKYEPRRICARPVRKADIRSTEFIPEGRLDGSGRMLIRIRFVSQAVCEFYIFQWEEMENLRSWLREQEKTTV